MKKLFALVLALLMLSGIVPALALTGPVLTPCPLDADAMPHGRLYPLGGSLLLIEDVNSGTLTLYDFATGQITPTTPREEDHAFWQDACIAALADEGIVLPEDELAELPDMDVRDLYASVLNYARPVACAVGQRYVSFRYVDMLLDCQTGEVLPLPAAECSRHLTPWDQFLCYDYWQGRCFLTDIGGAELAARDFSYSGYELWQAVPLENGVLVTLRDTDKEARRSSLRCVLLDQALNIRHTIDLGVYANRTLEVEQALLGYAACWSEETGRLLMFASNHQSQFYGELATVNGRREFVRHEPALCGLLVIDTRTGQCHPITMDVTPGIIGMPEGGAFALLGSWEGGLYRLDMETLAITEQMTAQELDALYKPALDPLRAMGYNAYPWTNCLVWDGGEYAVATREGLVFRVVERP